MLCVDIVNITSQQYAKLIQYLLDECDEITFQFPGIYGDGSPIPNQMWKEYHKQVQPLLQKCYHYGGKKVYSRHYQGMRLGEYGIIIRVKLFQYLKQKLQDVHLFDWLVQNNLPEDVCLYSQKTLRVFTCSHEDEFFLCNETEDDVNFLEENSFVFLKTRERN